MPMLGFSFIFCLFLSGTLGGTITNHDADKNVGVSRGFTKDEIDSIMKSSTFTLTDKTGIFQAILHECEKQQITKLPWETFKLYGNTLSDSKDVQALGELKSRFTLEYTNMFIYDTKDIGSVLTKLMFTGPDVEYVEEVHIRAGRIVTIIYIPERDNVKRQVWLFGYTDDSKTSDAIKNFLDTFTYKGMIGEVALRNINKETLPDASVLDRLFLSKVKKVDLPRRVPASHVFSASLLSSGKTATWKELYLGFNNVIVDQADRDTIDKLRANNVMSDKCVVRYNWSSLKWLPKEKKFDWPK